MLQLRVEGPHVLGGKRGRSARVRTEKGEQVSNLLRLIGRRLIALPIMIFGVTILVFFLMSLSPIEQPFWARTRRRRRSLRTVRSTD